MPKRGRAGSDRSRIALLHALAHIEFVAIDLAWDLVGRFGGEMPRRFTDDWVTVAAEESMHFALLDRRLRALASHYGALPAHDGLWRSEEHTSELQSLMRISYAVFCLTKKTKKTRHIR